MPGTGWLTGSLWGVFMMGFYPPEIRPLVTFGSWFEYMAVPWLIVTAVFFTLIYVLLKPKEKLAMTCDAFKEQYAALGKITGQETLTAIILSTTLLLFATEKLHHVSTPTVALFAFTALMMFRIITFPEISTGVNWDIIAFFGAALSLMAIFGNAGITAWAMPHIKPGILAFASQPLVFLLVITFGFWIIRFVDIPWGLSTVALTAPLFIPLNQDFGLNPALVSVAITAAGNCFFLAYQQPFIMVGDAVMKSRGWTPGQVSLAGICYAVSVIVALLISSFYWKAMGLMP